MELVQYIVKGIMFRHAEKSEKMSVGIEGPTDPVW